MVTVVVTKRKNERATARTNERRRRSRSRTVKLRKSSLMSACGECGIVLVLATVERKFDVRKSFIISERASVSFRVSKSNRSWKSVLSQCSAADHSVTMPLSVLVFFWSAVHLSPACLFRSLTASCVCVCRLRQVFARCLLCAFYCATWSSCGGMSRNVNCTCKRTQIEAV